jgi:hypothetical protein
MEYLNNFHSILDGVVEYPVIRYPKPEGRLLTASQALDGRSSCFLRFLAEVAFNGVEYSPGMIALDLL